MRTFQTKTLITINNNDIIEKTKYQLAILKISLSLLLFSLKSCSSPIVQDIECSKYENEIYEESNVINSEFNLQKEYKKLISKFGGSSIKGNQTESYQMLFYSSHGYGRTIKINKVEKGAKIIVRCIENIEAGYNCKNVELKVDSADWNTFEKMVYEFNYWTENQIEINSGYLDSFVYTLEGNRPEAKKCGKKNHRILIRGNPEYDKIASLCEQILIFVDMNTPVEITNYAF